MHRSRLLTFAAVIFAMLAATNMVFAQQNSADDQSDAAAPKTDQAKRPPAKSPARPPTKSIVQASVPTPAAQLPNGASSINETYADWTVDCRVVEGQKRCVLSQAQGNSQTGQRSFAIELQTPKEGKTEGTILMPFGLKLDTGALLKLDDKISVRDCGSRPAFRKAACCRSLSRRLLPTR